MHRKLLFIVALMLTIPGLAVGVAAANDPGGGDDDETLFWYSEETDATFVTASGETFEDDGGDSTVSLSATLSGTNEVDAQGNPGAGDLDGSGQASVDLSESGQVCWNITVTGIALPAAAAHIHSGAAGVNGPIVVPLDPPPDANGVSQACTSADPATVGAIAADPAAYYVNVHTTDFPDGAVRGQLAAATSTDGEEDQAHPGDQFFFRDDVFASDASGAKGELIGAALVQCTFGVVSSLQCHGAVTIDGVGQLHIAATFTDASQPEMAPFDIALVGGTGGFDDAGGDATLRETSTATSTVTLWEVHLLHLDDNGNDDNNS